MSVFCVQIYPLVSKSLGSAVRMSCFFSNSESDFYRKQIPVLGPAVWRVRSGTEYIYCVRPWQLASGKDLHRDAVIAARDQIPGELDYVW